MSEVLSFPTDEERKARKREYARLYRQQNRDALNAKQVEWYRQERECNPAHLRLLRAQAQARRQQKIEDNPEYITIERAKQREYQKQFRQRIVARGSGAVEEYQTRDREAHRQNRTGQRNARLKRDYGVTLADFDEMLVAQSGVCAICHQPETQVIGGILSHLCVDHNHETGQVRGLLCHRCNKTVGWIETLEETALGNLRRYLDQGNSDQAVVPEVANPRRHEPIHPRMSVSRGTHLRERYGLTVAEYNDKLVRQGFVCAVCHCPETQVQNGQIRNLSIDHDHRTGRIRGLLCARCNLTAGHLEPLDDVTAITMLRHLGRKVGLLE